ncbi:MAG: hypothetical protein O7D86_04180 [Proteobacteria bacterium]|nr:hypothetical protein [Pseudomonadota bacterium]
MIIATRVNETIYTFSQKAFRSEKLNAQLPDLSLESALFALLSSGSITRAEVKQLSKPLKNLLYHLLTQYIMFLEMNPSLSFPENFMQGSSNKCLGQPLLEYILKHRWPFPQLLAESKNESQ